MDPAKVKEIVDTWMIPTPGAAYMAGLEDRPVLAAASGSTVVDTTGREYLDFQSGQMGAALGHRHPRVMRAIEEAMLTASTYCLLPVVKVNGLALGEGRPGPVVGKLLEAWSQLVGVDIVEQAARYAR